ncbi:MAG: mechanosensitive ion channel family protein [Bacteroidia bacterium]|nr:mechanosensitive ion channel family protein [Bacteroidia bacterium]
MEQLIQSAWMYLPQLLLALVVLVAGWWISGRVARLVRRILETRSVDPALHSFLSDATAILLRALVVVTAAGMVGIQTTSFIAILGAASLAVGLALQGSLSNFAGGVMVLLFKPFRIGELIEAQGHLGHVRAINLFVTTLETPESRLAILPNGPLSNGNILNYSRIGYLRVDVNVTVGYKTPLEQARLVILEALRNTPHVLATPAPSVHVGKLGENGLELIARSYADPERYWDVFFMTQEQIKLALDSVDIEIPYPQRVVHQLREID